MVLVYLDVCMRKSPNRSISISLEKIHFLMDLNIKPGILNLMEEKAGNSIELIGTRKLDFLNRSPIAQALKSTINKWYIKKLKNFFWTRRQIKKWEKIFFYQIHIQ